MASRRFFRASGSESSDSESSEEQKIPVKTTAGGFRPKAFVFSESEDEEKPRIVRKAKDKRYDELKELIRQARNSKKIKDLSKVLTNFEELTKSYEKSKAILDREGGISPRFYIRYLAELEDFVNEIWEDKEYRDKLNKQNSKSLSSLRQKCRKYIREKFDREVAEYKESPDPIGYSSAEGEAEEDFIPDSKNEVISSSEDEKPLKPKAKQPVEDDISSDEDPWKEEEDSEDSESELSDLEGKKMEDLRRYFLKKDFNEEKGYEEKEKRKAERKEKEQARLKRHLEARQDLDDEGEWETVLGDKAKDHHPKMFSKDETINVESVKKKLDEILSIRGKKATNRQQLVDRLEELLLISRKSDLGSGIHVKIQFHILAGKFEISQKISDSMVYSVWESAVSTAFDLLKILEENPTFECFEDIGEENENYQDTTIPYKISGSILLIAERIDDEFIKILQDADFHTSDYIEKLKGEQRLCELLEQVRLLMKSRDFPQQEMIRIYSRCIDHVYYKSKGTSYSSTEIDDLCSFIYANEGPRGKFHQRAILCQIFFLALHDRWHQARDLFLMSHVQTLVDYSDYYTQLMHNRVVCQLGLCAFRHGYIRESHSILSDIQNSNRVRELLGQGVAMTKLEKTVEQEKLEKQRLLPYHLHFNLELLECVYLISAMLLEISSLSSKELQVRRRLLSRSFHYHLKQSERSNLVGPPETVREHIVAASKALLDGDWRLCSELVFNTKMNIKIWNFFQDRDKIKDLILVKIREGSLRTYLLSFSTVYSTISLSTLSEMFELEQPALHALIAKMIIKDEIAASLDEPAECLVLHRVEPSKLQILTHQLTDKLNSLADSSDMAVDPKSTSMASRQPFGGQQDYQQRQKGYNRQGGRYQAQRGRNPRY